MEKFDLLVLGAGPGGYPAAIKAAQNGAKVGLIEAQEVGGTCLNRGCIPSKTLIAGAETYRQIKNAYHFGIEVPPSTVHYPKLAEKKDNVVQNLRTNLEGLISANGIRLFRGFGRFISPYEIKVTGKDSAILQADKIIIATGSEPRSIPSFPCDGVKILDSTSLLNLKKLPKSIVIIGGGVIGCEFASLYRELGVEVTILEMLPTILSTESRDVIEAITTAFKKQGIKIQTNARVERILSEKNGVKVELKEGNPIESEIALVAVGRRLNTTDIGLEKAGLLTDEAGFISVNDKMETSVPGIYAVGDITTRWWLAHVATHQGVVAAQNATGKTARMSYEAIPVIIFTHPEVGSVGLSLEKAKEKGFDAAVGAFPFHALGKAQATGQTEGFAQVVIDRKTGQILGAQVVGYEASTLISEMVLAIANELTIECLTETIHGHPTFPEAWLEAGLIANQEPLHWPPNKRKKVSKG